MIQFKRGGQRKTCRIKRACSMLNRIRRLEIYRIHLPRRRAINSNKPPPVHIPPGTVLHYYTRHAH